MAPPDYKRPESVLVVVYTPDGDVLMLCRREPPDFWQSVTGSLEWGESPRAAARRELREETGLGLEPVDQHHSNTFKILPAWRDRYAPGTTTNLEHVFTAICPEPFRPVINADEHVEFQWLSRAEALEMTSSYTNRDAIEKYVSQ